jgi:tetratricopeptide (TPR) repeat protein
MHSFETRTLDDAAASLRRADGECVILMGAGCSKSAGIPLAGELIREVERGYPEAFQRATNKVSGQRSDYNAVMEQLSPRDREKLLNQHIKDAKLNWAHLALAQLFTHQKIDRVLTVNFDPLLVKACALVNFFPAIYDLAGNNQFKPRRIAPQSIFFLHGQHTGFVMLNGTDELDEHKTKLTQIVQNTGVNRLWLVVGYSGEADPLLDVLAEQESFDGDLYWLGYEPTPSERLLNSRLFEKGRRAFYIGGQDADKCLAHLAQNLQCFPPSFLIRPFEHLRQIVEPIDFETGGPAALLMRDRLFLQLEFATQKENSPEQQNISNAKSWLLAGEPHRVIEWYEQLPNKTQEAMELVSWAHTLKGNILGIEAEDNQATNPPIARNLWNKAGQEYTQALKIKPDMHEAAHSWGVALAVEANALSATDLPAARLLWSQAGQKYLQALAIKPDTHEAAYNWGNALADEAQALRATDLPAARLLWSQAGQKYAQALAIKPDKYEAAFNWGVALNAKAVAIKAIDLPAARLLWSQARQKYAQALAIKPDRYETAHNWGNALAFEAHAIQAEYPQEAQKLWVDASEKYDLALRIKPDMHEAATMLGPSLIFLYQLTISSNPTEAETYLTRAIALLEKHSAMSREGREVVAYNLACAYSLQGRAVDAVAQLDICISANKLAPHWRDEKDFEPIRHTPEFLAWVEKNFPETTTAPT